MCLKRHLVYSLVIRLILVVYGEIQDKISELPYTDVDYRVVTDGAEHVHYSRSPYNRHTYRYTPLLAYLLLPNILVHRCFGKLLFVFFDLVIAVLIKKIIVDEYWLAKNHQTHSIESNKAKLEKKFVLPTASGFFNKMKSNRIMNPNKKESSSSWFSWFLSSAPIGSTTLQKFERMGNLSAYVWLYNPLTMVIATRGNGDSITSALVLISIYYLLKVQQPKTSDDSNGETTPEKHMCADNEDEKSVIVAGFFHGLAIHFRLYPIFFSLAYFLYLSDHKHGLGGSLVKCLLKPNRKQVLLILSVLKTLIFTTGIFYLLYQYQFLYESTLYHFVRKDTRHNFSLFFYLQYLTGDNQVNLLEKLLTISPQMLLIVLISIHFCKSRQTLLFALFLISFLMVTYNSVITSQYFVWFLSLLPLSLHNLRNLSIKRMLLLPLMWFLGQGSWLLSAYFLEFRGFNTFDFIWLQSVVFFTINIIIIQILISNFDVFSIKLK